MGNLLRDVYVNMMTLSIRSRPRISSFDRREMMDEMPERLMKDKLLRYG